MARPRLVSPDQPLPVRFLLGICEFFASLKLAFSLIGGLSFVLGLATCVEAAYGTDAVQYLVYQTWWFELLNALLAVNIFSAAAIRFPWKRYQTGFVITHVGLLVLCFSCLLSRRHFVDAQIPIYEYRSERWAFENSFQFVLHENSKSTGKDDGKKQETTKPIPIQFPAGPFNWEDYDTLFNLVLDRDKHGDVAGLPGYDTFNGMAFRGMTYVLSRAARTIHPGEVMHDEDGIKLEVLDYFADSKLVDAPAVKLFISMPRGTEMGEDGKMRATEVSWVPMSLNVREVPTQPQYKYGIGDRKSPGGGSFLFWVSPTEEATEAFLEGGPEGPIGIKGQVVIHVGGKKVTFLVDEHEDGGKFPLGETEWSAEVVQYLSSAVPDKRGSDGAMMWANAPDPNAEMNPAVRIKLYKGDKDAGELFLLSDLPEINLQQYERKVYGEYWFDHGDKTAQELMRMRQGGSRIDVVQGKQDGKTKLFYRYWNRKKIVASGELNAKGDKDNAVNAFTMPMAQLKMYATDFVPSDKPGKITLPLPFDRSKGISQRSPTAKVKLTVDDEEKEFWIGAYMQDPGRTPTTSRHLVTAKGKDRNVTLTMPVESVDVGFRIYLHDFERKLDPGTSQASHYSSVVDFRDLRGDRMVHREESGKGEDFIISSLPEHASSVVDAAGEWVYWGDVKLKQILRRPVETPDFKTLRPENAVPPKVISHAQGQPVAVALDEKAKRIYWVETSLKSRHERVAPTSAKIYSAKLDGQDHQEVAEVEGTPLALALDTKNKRIYWSARLPRQSPVAGQPVNTLTGAIGSVGFDGKEMQARLVENLGYPSALAIDGVGKQIFWAEPVEGSIHRANWDGSDDARVIALEGGPHKPTSLAIDSKSKRIYWTDWNDPEHAREDGDQLKAHSVLSANLDGSDVVVVADKRVYHPSALQLHDDGTTTWTQDATYKRKVWITMNAPVEFSDRRDGTSYRLFQESFGGPWKPGSPLYEELVPDVKSPDAVFMSVLTVNHDPGRGIRGIGLGLIVVGIAVMFYMRAYFYTPTPGSKKRGADVVSAKPAQVNQSVSKVS